MNSAQALLHHAIDYAGLFPPAALDLPTTVANYQAYLEGHHAWALGRLVLPAALASEFVMVWPSLDAKAAISIVVGRSATESLLPMRDLGFPLDSIECHWTGPSEADRVQSYAAPNAKVFFEIPTNPDPETLIHELAVRGACAKIRTGGVTASAIPSVEEVARFIASCMLHKVPFKATAGLHHPLCGEYALNYEENSPRAVMHGYVNLILASAMLYEGGDAALACRMLGDASPANFSFASEGIAWCDHIFTTQAIAGARERFMLSFGSCSFVEPVTELVS